MKRLLIIFTSATLLLSCGGDTKDTAKQLEELKKQRAELDKEITELELIVNADNPVEGTPVAVMEAVPASFRSFIEVQATITGDENINATSQAAGVVSSIYVRPGQSVRKGQTLASLDAAAITQQMKAQEAQLTLLRQLYDKQQKLWAQNIGSEIQLLQAKANYESAQKQYQALVAQRNMYRISAPVSGIVDAVDIKVGDMVSPGSPNGIRVVSLSDMKAEAKLGENYIGKVNKGDAVTLSFNDIGKDILTKLSYVSRSVDPISRAFDVQVWLGSRSDIRPNMSCKMKILNYQNANAISVPVAAVQQTEDADILYLVRGDKAIEARVETGKTSEGYVEIVSGVAPGDLIIIEGQTDIADGEKIVIQK